MKRKAEKLTFRRRRRLLPNCNLNSSGGNNIQVVTAFHRGAVTQNISDDTEFFPTVAVNGSAIHTEEIPPLQPYEQA